MSRNTSALVLATSSLLALAPLFAPSARADGFRNPPPGAAALGQGGNVQALGTDAAATSFNPANLTRLAAPELYGGFLIARSRITFETPDGFSAKSENDWQALPHLYFGTGPVGGDRRLHLGMGLTTPYGQSAEWDRNSPFKYSAPYQAEMSVVSLNPNAAYRLCDRLSVGAGVDLFSSMIEFKQEIPWTRLNGTPDGVAKFEADGAGLGVNAGLAWRPGAGQALALTYRSPVRVDYEGDFTVTGHPMARPGGELRTDFETDITFPDRVGLAWGMALTDALRVEADAEWLKWSRVDNLPLDVDSDFGVLPGRSIPYDWKDTWTYGVGAAWDVAANWTLRAGYTFIESPVPNETFSPILSDADQHVYLSLIHI